jgi:hypothetical protein
VLIELKLSFTEDFIKSNMEYMYYPGFRAFFLTLYVAPSCTRDPNPYRFLSHPPPSWAFRDS